MIKFQKIIKYLSIAFAFFLVISILNGICSGINYIFNIRSNDVADMELIDIADNVNVLDIDIDKVDLKVVNADDFKMSISDKGRIRYDYDNERLIIKDASFNLFDDEVTLVIYVPNDKVFESVFINTAAGSMEIDNISTNKLDFDLGIGNVNIADMIVNEKADIDSGVGDFVISDGVINNLELSMGVGDVSITSSIGGKSEFDSGIGNLTLGLVGLLDDYKIEVENGIGTIKVDGVKINNEEIVGNGSNYIEINGGIGDVYINYID